MRNRDSQRISGFLKSLLALAGLVVAVSGRADDAAMLSNILPKKALSQMSAAGLPILAIDENGSREHAEILRFWNTLNGENLDAQAAVDQLFGAELRSFSSRERELYSMKYILLRERMENDPKNKALAHLFDVFKNRYISTSSLIVSLSDFEEVKRIVAAFSKRLKAGEILIRDLSPDMRKGIDEQRETSHGVRLQELLPNSRRYQVSGLFQSSTGILAVDFSRSVEENLITLIHEIVHAADPRLIQYRSEFTKLWPAVAKILVRYTDDPAQIVPLHSLDHSFEKAELGKLESILIEARQEKSEKLKDVVSAAKLSDNEKATLEKWTRAAIGLTVENEFRAYALSIVLYSKLKNRYRLFVDNQSVLRDFTEKLIAGDRSFALRISSDNTAFDRLENFVTSSMRARTSQERFITQVLESFYLTSMEDFMKGLGEEYAREIPRDNPPQFESHSELPEWARPGGFDLPSNPYQILNARISTAWTVAFSNSLKHFNDELVNMNEPLWLLNAGILDLHDISVGELKVLGLHFVDSPFSSYPKELPERLRADVASLPQSLQDLFELHHFSPALQSEGDSIQGSELREKLIGLRLLKASLWIDESLPPLSNSIMGTRGFIEKLTNGINIDQSEIPEKRKEELLAELGDALKLSNKVYDQMGILRTIAAKLGNFSKIAESSKLMALSQSFQKKSTYILSVIENYGILGSEDKAPDKIEERLQASRMDFVRQLSAIKSSCKDLNRRRQLGFFPAHGPYTVEGYTFSPMILCWDNKIYVIRQPGDYSKFMTTTLRNNKPHSRIFMGARPIELEAIGSIDDIR